MGGRNTEVGSCLRSVATRAECKLECDNLSIGETCSEPNVLIGRSTDPKGKRVVITALTVIGVASFFGSMVLFEHYATTRSHQADAAAGRIYQLNNHGSYVYLTRSEQWPVVSTVWRLRAIYYERSTGEFLEYSDGHESGNSEKGARSDNEQTESGL